MNAFLKKKETEIGTLKVEVWLLAIARDMRDAMNGSYHRIKELYIPSLGISINAENFGNLNVFDSQKQRRYKPHEKGGPFYHNQKDPELIDTIILKGEEAQKIRDLAELHILEKGFQREVKPLICDILSKYQKKEES